MAMIDTLTITNFKCFSKSHSFNLKRMNVFAGYNGRGKSSVFQTILLLAQSLVHNGHVEELDVNGEFVSLDLFEDLVNCNHTDNPILFELSQIEPSITVLLGYREESDRRGRLDELQINGVDYFNSKVSSTSGEGEIQVHSLSSEYPRSFHDLLRDIDYVSAFRVGPTKFEEKSDLNSINPVGRDGEHSLSVIINNKGLIERVNRWMDYIMDGVTMSIDGKNKNDSVLNLKMKMRDGDKQFKSLNCGFGYRYVLPIVIAALTKEKGSLFIENPEAHLHPKAQSRLMEMLCTEMGSKNVQIFIETHSEHIINGIRLNALKPECHIHNSDVSLFFFDRDYSCIDITMDSDGQMSSWPRGFFDQQEVDLTEILKMGLLK